MRVRRRIPIVTGIDKIQIINKPRLPKLLPGSILLDESHIIPAYRWCKHLFFMHPPQEKTSHVKKKWQSMRLIPHSIADPKQRLTQNVHQQQETLSISAKLFISPRYKVKDTSCCLCIPSMKNHHQIQASFPKMLFKCHTRNSCCLGKN